VAKSQTSIAIKYFSIGHRLSPPFLPKSLSINMGIKRLAVYLKGTKTQRDDWSKKDREESGRKWEKSHPGRKYYDEACEH
jgi:hypothetical protein